MNQRPHAKIQLIWKKKKETPKTSLNIRVIPSPSLLLLYCDKFCPLCQFLPHYGLNFRKPLLSSQPPLSQSGEKIVLKQGNFREQKKPNPFPLSPPLHSKLGCLLFSVGSLNRGTTLCGSDGRGKALCFPFEVSKMSDNPFQGEVSQLILSLIEQSPG